MLLPPADPHDDGRAVVSAETLLAVVERSPAAVARHDRVEWITLFAADFRIEDPVGSRPHLPTVGHDVIARFYDTFIAPNEIVFHRGRDFVDGLCILRDLEIEIRMKRQVVIRVPMFLVYELVAEGSELRIRRLAAHWELRRMLAQFMRHGMSVLPAMLALGTRMLRLQGLAGTWGFMRALRSVGEPGKRALRALIERGDVAPFDRTGDKILAAGDSVMARVQGPHGEGVAQMQCDGAGMPRMRVWTHQLKRTQA